MNEDGCFATFVAVAAMLIFYALFSSMTQRLDSEKQITITVCDLRSVEEPRSLFVSDTNYFIKTSNGVAYSVDPSDYIDFDKGHSYSVEVDNTDHIDYIITKDIKSLIPCSN
jgi:hypothetical protein